MTTLRDLVDQGQAVSSQRPWPRALVSKEIWQHAIGLLADGRCTLLALWGEKQFVHMALIEAEGEQPAVLSLACEEQRFPSVARPDPLLLDEERESL